MNNVKNNWFQLAFKIEGSVIPSIFTRVLFCTLFSLLISVIDYFKLPIQWSMFGGIIPNVISNLVLGLLLVFRTNTAYERFWEGRKEWGLIILNVRNLARQIKVYISENNHENIQEKNAAMDLLVAFAIATRLHLRNQEINGELKTLMTEEQFNQLKSVNHPPLEISLWIGNYLKKQYNQNCLSMDQLTAMNTLLDNMVSALTGCERIAYTPMPIAYAIHLKQLLLLYCLSLPFQIINDLQWYSAPIVGLISFTLLGIEEIGNEIENPFDGDANDLPLDEICQALSQNVADLIKSSVTIDN